MLQQLQQQYNCQHLYILVQPIFCKGLLNKQVIKGRAKVTTIDNRKQRQRKMTLFWFQTFSKKMLAELKGGRWRWWRQARQPPAPGLCLSEAANWKQLSPSITRLTANLANNKAPTNILIAAATNSSIPSNKGQWRMSSGGAACTQQQHLMMI